jgi:adenine-specific DNA-methyltransferase
MTSRISYMGTKHELAPAVRRVIQLCQPGRLLDAFAGMGAVAESLAGERAVWTNDMQHFAHLASSCRLAEEHGPLSSRAIARLARPLFDVNFQMLREQNSAAFRLGRQTTRADSYTEFLVPYEQASSLEPCFEESYSCFTKTYSHGYFSLEQCAEIDSVRYALEILRGRGSITHAQFDWSLLALGAAILRVANTTGHFAQFLRPSQENYRRVQKQFQRKLWREWLISITRIRPAGTPTWRRGNMATRSDSASLLSTREYANEAKVVYCDPPYTDDQYSRYYHIWETLILYDYPAVTGQGRYRAGRFTTDFSLASKVSSAFELLIRDVASSGADLVLSYPSNGLLHNVGGCPLELLRSSYKNVRLMAEIEHRHSTMGASKGPAKSAVSERIYLAQDS